MSRYTAIDCSALGLSALSHADRDSRGGGVKVAPRGRLGAGEAREVETVCSRESAKEIKFEGGKG